MSSDESEDDNENLAELNGCIDTTFLPESLYNPSEKEDKNHTKVSENSKIDEIPDNDLKIHLNTKIPSSTRKFFSKALSKFIENQIEFKDLKEKEINGIEDEGLGLKLLAESENNINLVQETTDINKVKKKPKIKKRTIIDDCDNLSSEEKIKLAVIEPNQIINKIGMEHWKDRKKSKIYKYKSKSGPPYQFIEPDNEFSALRRKNSWSLKKISRTFAKGQK